MDRISVSALRDGRLPDPGSIAVPAEAHDLLAEYIESVTGQVEELEQEALAYEQAEGRPERAAAIRRILHKIKGESGMVGLAAIERIFHEAENAFETLPESQRAEMLLGLKDWVTAVVAHWTE